MAITDNEFNFEDISKNPYIPKPDDYFEGYNKSIGENFDPNTVKYAQLTHTLFTSTAGKQWLVETKKLLADSFVDLSIKNPALHLASVQGARELLVSIDQNIAVFDKHLEGK